MNIKALVPISVALFVLITLTLPGCKDNDPQPACIETNIADFFLGESLTLTSCNSNAKEYRWQVYTKRDRTYPLFYKTGQTVTFNDFQREDLGALRIVLSIEDNNGTSEKEMQVTLKSGAQNKINDNLSFVVMAQLPNGDFLLDALSYSSKEYLTLLTKDFSKKKAWIGGENYKSLIYADMCVNTDGVVLLGNANNNFTTRFHDFEGDTVWQKKNFPLLLPATYGPTKIVRTVDAIGNIVASSLVGTSDAKAIVASKMLEQDVSWEKQITHPTRAYVDAILSQNNEYIIISSYTTTIYIDVLDEGGNILRQHSIQKDKSIYSMRCLANENGYVLAYSNLPSNPSVDKTFVTVLTLNTDFTEVSEINLSEISEVSFIEKTASGYTLLANGCRIVKVGADGSVTYSNNYCSSFRTTGIKDNDGNYVFAAEAFDYDGQGDYSYSLEFYRLTPEGRIVLN